MENVLKVNGHTTYDLVSEKVAAIRVSNRILPPWASEISFSDFSLSFSCLFTYLFFFYFFKWKSSRSRRDRFGNANKYIIAKACPMVSYRALQYVITSKCTVYFPIVFFFSPFQRRKGEKIRKASIFWRRSIILWETLQKLDSSGPKIKQ